MRGPLVAQRVRAVCDRRLLAEGARRRRTRSASRHRRGGRRMTKAEIHRMLQNPIYTGDFRWLGQASTGLPRRRWSRARRSTGCRRCCSGKPRGAVPEAAPRFMGLLTCGRCGCAMTAEQKKGKYVYYRCTGFKGALRQHVHPRGAAGGPAGATSIKPIQIPTEVAEWHRAPTPKRPDDVEQRRLRIPASARQRSAGRCSAKLDRGYDDYLEGRISEEFWTRKSEEWEAELRTSSRTRARRPAAPRLACHGAEDFRTRETGRFLYKSQNPAEQRRLLETVLSNCTFDRGTLCPTYAKPFDLFVGGTKLEMAGRRDSVYSRP